MTVDLDRALVEVHLERCLDVVAERAGAAQEMGDRPVAMARDPLRVGHVRVDRQRSAGELGVSVEQPWSTASSPWAAWIRSAAVMAPALTIALVACPVTGSRLMALNASPVGSRPMRWPTTSGPSSSRAIAYVNGLDIDWIVKPSRVSPTSYDGSVDHHDADAETVGVDMGEFGDVRRDLAGRVTEELGVQLLEVGGQGQHGRSVGRLPAVRFGR